MIYDIIAGIIKIIIRLLRFILFLVLMIPLGILGFFESIGKEDFFENTICGKILSWLIDI